jgi:hypothetical protein
LEPAKLIFRRHPPGVFLADKMTQTGIPNRQLKRFQFEGLPLRLQFHAAIRQIPDRSRDFITKRHLLHRGTKPNSLNPAGVIDMKSLAGHRGYQIHLISHPPAHPPGTLAATRLMANEATLSIGRATILFPAISR